MPKIVKVLSIDITPEKFLSNCTPEELMEVELLICSPRFRVPVWNHNQKQTKQLRIDD